MTIRRVLLALPVVACGWLITLLAVSLLTDAAPAYVVISPQPGIIASLDPDVSILASGRGTLTVSAKAPAAAKRLYRAGAWLVLPAGLPGCLPLPRRSEVSN